MERLNQYEVMFEHTGRVKPNYVKFGFGFGLNPPTSTYGKNKKDVMEKLNKIMPKCVKIK